MRGRISCNQNVIKLTFTAGNFDNYKPNYLIKSVKLCYMNDSLGKRKTMS